MHESPILFSAPMVRAILDGRKMQTRRLVKPQPPARVGMVNAAYCGNPDLWLREGSFGGCAGPREWRCPYGRRGNHLWVRETWGQLYPLLCDEEPVFWRADYSQAELREQALPKWRPSIHMPRWASRLTLEVVAVWTERLKDISEADAIAEGLHCVDIGSGYLPRYSATPFTGAEAVELGRQAGIDEDPRLAYRDLWDQINGSGSWDANPWVWVVEFQRIGQ